uniref:Paired domain-containing protein n=1 Tax=Acrobeloides nanus TaxID=290746 RepID=A0A914CU28_9BILA
MKSLKNLRDAIIRAHERGKKQVEIAVFLGISTSTVNDAIKRYKETGNNEDRKGRSRKKTARSRKNVQCAKGMIKRLLRVIDPRRKSVPKASPECGILEKGAEKDLVRNNLGNPGQDRRQFLQASESLHRCQGWTF